MMTYKLNIGDKLPHFTAQDQLGNVHHSEGLLGGPLVMFFYPKDDTPGCTKEACGFRDQHETLTKLGAVVIGISPDTANSHQQFIEKYRLNFNLFSDPKKELCHLFDVIREKSTPEGKKLAFERTTYVIDPFGTIIWIERPVNVEGHIERVLKTIQTMNK